MLDAQGFKIGALFRRAGGGEDFGPGQLRQLHRGQSHPPGGGMDQRPFPALQAGFFCAAAEDVQRIFGGQEGDRQGGRLFKAQGGRFSDGKLGWRVGVGAEAVRGQGQDRIADPKAFAAFRDCADGGDDAAAFVTQPAGLAGVHAQCVQHVAEVQSRGADANLNFAGTRLAARRGLECQGIQHPALFDDEARAFLDGGWRGGGDEMREVAPAVAVGDLAKGGLCCQLGEKCASIFFRQRGGIHIDAAQAQFGLLLAG